MRDFITEIIREGLIYTPEFIRKSSNKTYGDVVTHEDYNELVNLNTEQGDYNTEVLRVLFTEIDDTKVYHIPYMDNLLQTELEKVYDDKDEILEHVDHLEDRVDAQDTIIAGVREDMDVVNTKMGAIESGATAIPHAIRADMISGVASAGPFAYYGTDEDEVIGFHRLPPMIYADDVSIGELDISPIAILPRANTVDESMLTEAVRTKLNRQDGVTDYDYLDNRPLINHVLLTGDRSLLELGIQPAGNYLTEVPSTYSTTSEVTTMINNAISAADILTTTSAASTYATITDLNNVSTTANAADSRSTTNANNISTIQTTYTRVGINTAPSDPHNGDLYITV